MKLFVIGATGRTGREIVEQALTRGHQMTAFVCSPEGIKLKNERLAVIKGDAMNEDKLANATQRHEAVVSTLGPRQVFKPASMLHDSALATTRAMTLPVAVYWDHVTILKIMWILFFAFCALRFREKIA